MPALADLVVDGVPAYAWPPVSRGEWAPPSLSFVARAFKRLTAAR